MTKKRKDNVKTPGRFDSLDPRAHLGLVYKCAAWAADRFGGHREDWVGPAYLGLLDGLRTFQPDKGFRVSTHLVTTIRWKLDSEHKRSLGGVRCSGRNGVHWRFPASLDSISAHWDSGTWERLFGRRDAEPAETGYGQSGEWILGVARRVAGRRGVEMLLAYARGRTLESVGQEFGVTKERVRQLLNRIRNACGAVATGRFQTARRARRKAQPRQVTRDFQRAAAPGTARAA